MDYSENHNNSDDGEFYEPSSHRKSSKMLDKTKSQNEINELKKYDPSSQDYESVQNEEQEYNHEYSTYDSKVVKSGVNQKHQEGSNIEQVMRKTATFDKQSPNHNKTKPIKATAHSTFQADSQQSEPITAEQLSDINHKLKLEMSTLIERLEAAFNKFKERKEKEKYRNGITAAYNGLSQINEDFAQKEKDLKSAQVRAINVKKEIMKIQRNLETAYDIGAITELENDIKNKEALLAKLEDQNKQIKKVGAQQQMAMDDLNKEEELQQKLREINNQIRQTKIETKDASQKFIEIDKVVQDQHKKIYDMEERYRKVTILIKQRNKLIKSQRNTTTSQDNELSLKGAFVDPDDQLTEEQIELDIKAMEEVRLEGEKNVRKMIADLDKKIVSMKEEQEFSEVRLREKEQDIKLVDLKVREIKRSQVFVQSQQRAAVREEKEKDKRGVKGQVLQQ